MPRRLPGRAIQAGTITVTQLETAVANTVQTGGGPKITAVTVTNASYNNLDDTAVDIAGGYIKITGTGFVTGCQVLINNTPATSTTYIGPTEVRAQVPATAAGTYMLYVINADGGVAIRVNGVTFSATPSWVTASDLAGYSLGDAISIQLAATGATTFALAQGSTLPTGLTLTSGGLLSGSVTGLENDTSYSFTITATDAELQDSPRTFSITITVQLQVSRSLRFNSADSTSLSWIPSRTGNLQTFTVSCWIKRSAITGSGNPIMVAGTDANDYFYINLTSTDTLAITTGENGTANANNVATSAVFRDVGAWYHVVINCDFSNATSTDRIRAYVNGVRQTLTGTFAAATFTGTRHNRAGITHYIGRWMNGSPYFSGYITEFYFIDGQALLPGQFADTNVTTGQYIPKKYTGTYGTNGFYLPFTDNSSVLSLGRNYQILTADPFWNQTVLLLNGTGTNNANNNTFTDSSTNAFAITRNGNTTQGRFSPFTQGGYSFSTTATNTYDLPGSVIAFGSSSFTLEAWVFLTHANGAPIVYPYDSGNNPAYGGFSIGFGTTGSSYYAVNGATPINYSGTFSQSTWYHLALVKDGTAARLYIDGKLVATGTDSTTYATPTGGARIGGIYNLTQTYGLVVNNLRIVTNQALYNSNFTPANVNLTTGFVGHQGLESTAITGTVRVLTARDPYLIDRSTNNHTISVSGSPRLVPLSPFASNVVAYSASIHGGSAYFDGTGDYLSVPANASWNLGSGAFCIECWSYPTATQSDRHLFSLNNSGGTGYWVLRYNTGTVPQFIYNNYATSLTSSTAAVINAWNHIAMVSNGTTMSLYLNGKRVATASATSINDGSANSLIIGSQLNVSPREISGYLTDGRVVKGSAVYDPTQTTITVPTAPLTAVANTAILLNFVNGSIVDATGDNNLETVGDAKISTAQSKWGGSSMLFDGTGDYLQLPASDIYAFGSGDYTVEAWVYFTSIDNTTLQIIFMSGSTEGNSFYCHVDGNQISVGTSLAFISNQATTITTGQWYHIAFCRSGTTLRLFVNGTQAGSNATDTTSWTSSGYARVGANGIGTQTVFGYIQDLRITRAARYTGNFIPPTAQFAYNQGDINYNQWVPTNFSVTAGAGNDSLLDVPTNWGVDTGLGGEVRGNYCTLNPLDISNCTVRNGNLDITTTSGSWGACRATIGVSTGKWYWEVTATNLVTTNEGVRAGIGIATGSANVATNNVAGLYTGTWAIYNQGASLGSNGGSFITYGASWQTGDIIGIALDCDAGTLVFYKNGVSLGTAVSGLTSGPYFPIMSLVVSGAAMTANFGQRPFAYAAPSGFKALNTHNLATPNVVKSNTAFDTVLYTGTGSALTVGGLSFSPDLVWIKSRSSASWWHQLQDTVRGATKRLASNDSGVEATDATTLTAFNADGFSLGTSTSYNENASTYVAWAWDAGIDTVVNTAGSISANVRVNTTAGISIVSYTGTQATATVGHGLGVAPKLIIAKSRSVSTTNWVVYHSSLGSTSSLLILNLTNATTTITNYWGSAVPTSTVFGVANGVYDNNNGSMIAYCFAEVPGYSAFGSYTGNGSADGPFVYLGFRPRFIMIKSTGVESWGMWDSVRNSYNFADDFLLAQSSNAEQNGPQGADILSNGFKIRGNYAINNTSSQVYIYAAFAESPFKYARAR